MAEEKRILKGGEITRGENLNDQYLSFLSMTVHDLLAPLRKLGVLTDRLTERFGQTGDAEVGEYTRRIHSCMQEMRSIINGCRLIAEAVPENMQVTDVNMAEIADLVVKEKSPDIKESNAEINIKDLPLIQGDKDQLKALFNEIIENALVFTKKDLPLKMDISCEKIEKKEREYFRLGDKEYLKFIFRDNGIGFKKDEAERMFEPTVRLHGKSAFPGNGLGLTLARKIVSNHQGCVYAESNVEGSSFMVILPKTQTQHATGK